MPMLILDPLIESDIVRQRRERGIDRRDEVWDGTYIIFPTVDNLHQELMTHLLFVLASALGPTNHLQVYPGLNVSDEADNWERNYRCPDVVVNDARIAERNRHSHLFGGPEFLVEILTPNDRTRDKLPFYASVNTREVLVIDRDPWQLELYHLQNGVLVPVGVGNLSQPAALPSSVLPVSFQLIAGADRPRIEIRQTTTGQVWAV